MISPRQTVVATHTTRVRLTQKACVRGCCVKRCPITSRAKLNLPREEQVVDAGESHETKKKVHLVYVAKGQPFRVNNTRPPPLCATTMAERHAPEAEDALEFARNGRVFRLLRHSSALPQRRRDILRRSLSLALRPRSNWRRIVREPFQAAASDVRDISHRWSASSYSLLLDRFQLCFAVFTAARADGAH